MGPVRVDLVFRVSFPLAKVHNELLSFVSVKEQFIVITPHSQVLHLLTLGEGEAGATWANILRPDGQEMQYPAAERDADAQVCCPGG